MLRICSESCGYGAGVGGLLRGEPVVVAAWSGWVCAGRLTMCGSLHRFAEWLTGDGYALLVEEGAPFKALS